MWENKGRVRGREKWWKGGEGRGGRGRWRGLNDEEREIEKGRGSE